MTGPALDPMMGVRAFGAKRDPVEQARELEVWLRLQRHMADSMNQAPQELPPGAGVSMGPITLDPSRYSQGQPPQAPKQQQMGAAPVAPVGQSGVSAARSALMASQAQDGLAEMDPSELVNRAKYLGVDNAENIPAEALRAIVAQRRIDMRPSEQRSNPVMAAGMLGNVLLHGFAQGISESIDHVGNLMSWAAQNSGGMVPGMDPNALAFGGEMAHRMFGKDAAQKYLQKYDEGIKANLTPDELQVHKVFDFAGSILGYLPAGEGAFKGVNVLVDGAAGVIPGAARIAGSPIARGVVAGAGTALALDAGTDKPWLPSARDFGAVLKGDQSIGATAGAAFNLLMGSRLMNAATGGLMAGAAAHFSKTNLPHQESTAVSAMRGGDEATGFAQQHVNPDGSIDYEFSFDHDGNMVAHPVGERPDYFADNSGGGAPPPAGGPPPGYGPTSGYPSSAEAQAARHPGLRDLGTTGEPVGPTMVNGRPVADQTTPDFSVPRTATEELSSPIFGQQPGAVTDPTRLLNPPMRYRSADRVEYYRKAIQQAQIDMQKLDPNGRMFDAARQSFLDSIDFYAQSAQSIHLDRANFRPGVQPYEASPWAPTTDVSVLPNGEVPVDMPTEAVPVPSSSGTARMVDNTPPELRQLRGPLRQSVAGTADMYDYEIKKRLQQLEGFRQMDPASFAAKFHLHQDYMPQLIEKVQAEIDDFSKAKLAIYSNPKNFRTRSPEDIGPQLNTYRAQFADLEDQINLLYGKYSPPDSGQRFHANKAAIEELEQQRDAVEDEFAALLNTADIPRHGAGKVINTWQAMGQPEYSPATPARDLVQQYGTTELTKEGTPKMFFSGTGVGYDTIDPVKLAQSSNLFGPGFYATDHPMVAGGDPYLTVDETGYAQKRHGQIEAARGLLTMQIQDYEHTISEHERLGPASGITDDVYNELVGRVQALKDQLGQMPLPAANVRPVFLATRKLFEADQPFSLEQGMQILEAGSAHPDIGQTFDFRLAAEQWQQYHNEHTQDMLSGYKTEIQGADFYHWAKNKVAAVSADFDALDPDTWSQQSLDDVGLNKVLQFAGYDGVAYSGGNRIGSPIAPSGHRAINIFDPKHVISSYISGDVLNRDAAMLGINLQKTAELMDSPIADDIAAVPAPNDAHVAASQAANNPGGLHVIRGVSNIQEVMNTLEEQLFNGSYDGLIKAYRIVEHPKSGRLDLLVSSLGQIDDAAVNMYSQYGVLPGMDVTMKKSGKTGKIIAVYDDNVVWQSDLQARRNTTSRAKHGDYMESPNSRHTIDSPGMWESFKAASLQHVAQLHEAAGHSPEGISITDPDVYARMAQNFDAWAQAHGINEPGVKGAIFRAFDQHYIDEIKSLAPDLSAMIDAQDEAISAADAASNDTPDLHSLAGMKGYDLHTQPDGSFLVVDQFSSEKYPAKDEATVEDFLHHAPQQRVPDATPASEVPMEALPVYHDGDLHVQPDQDVQDAQYVEDMLADMDGDEFQGDDPIDEPPTAIEPSQYVDVGAGTPEPPAGAGGGPRQAYTPPNNGWPGGTNSWAQTPGGGSGGAGGSGGGGGRGRGPRGGASGASGGRGPNPKAARRAALLQQIDTEGVATVQHNWQKSILAKGISPMRVYFANLENDLYNAGAHGLKPWRDFDAIISGQDVGHNKTYFRIEDIGKELANVGRKKLRDGSWSRMWLIQDSNNRALLATAKGFTKSEVLAMNKVDRILRDMHTEAGENGPAMVKALKQMIVDSRTMHENKQFGPSSYVSPLAELDFYKDHLSDTRMRFEKVDPRSLLRGYVRAWGFDRNAGPAWRAAKQTWNDVANVTVEGERKFADLASHMTEWMDYMKRGPQPGKDLAVRAVNRVLRMFQVPLTHGETRALMGGMQNNMYQAFQGWRLHVLARDATQPLLAAPTVDFVNLARAYKTASMIGSKARDAMKSRAYEYGVTQHAMPRFEGTGTFESPSDPSSGEFNRWQQGIRDVAANVGDVVRDLTPTPLRNFNLGVASPLGLYTREGEWHRIIVGEAAHTKFQIEHEKWRNQTRAAALMGDPNLVPVTRDFLDAINATSLRPSITREIEKQFNAGNIEGAQGALGIYMRAIADRTQFTYGARHAPPAIRSTAARMGYAFGNFSTQSIALLKEAIRYGNPTHKFKMAAVMLGTWGAFELLKKETGWNFRQYEWWQSLLFTGSPLSQQVIQTVSAANAARNVLTSDNPNQASVDELSNLNAEQMAGTILKTYNPYQGALWDYSNYSKASDAPNPLMASARVALTGDTRGSSIDMDNFLKQGLANQPAANSRFGSQVVPSQPTPQYPRTEPTVTRPPGASQYPAHDTTYAGLVNGLMGLRPGVPVPTPPETTGVAGLGGGKGAF